MLGHELAAAFSDGSRYETLLWDREEMDITDQEEVMRKIGEEKPQVIIKAAAYTAVDQAESEEELVYKINGYAVGYLAHAAKQVDALLVHFSTDYVFDGLNHLGYKEDHSLKNPVTVYGKSKKLAEQMIDDIAPRHFLIRTQWLFGSRGKNFIETMLRLAGEGKELKVVNDQFGSPTYAKDLAERVRQMVEEERPSGTYHVTSAGTCSWYDFTLLIFRLTGLKPEVRPVKSEEFAAPAKRPTYSMLINTKLPPLRSYEQALRAYLIETGRIKEEK
jgi:dTDP-4-dehydrorhamnose reductase